jgi:hypothetical protein
MSNYDVKWTNHATEAFAVAAKFRVEERFADVSVLCDDQCIPAHRVVLAACSAYFDRIFGRIDASGGNCARTAIVLKDSPSFLVRLAIEFMYAGEVRVPCEDFPSFMALAETLELRGLKKAPSSNAAAAQAAAAAQTVPVAHHHHQQQHHQQQQWRLVSKPREFAIVLFFMFLHLTTPSIPELHMPGHF